MTGDYRICEIFREFLTIFPRLVSCNWEPSSRQRSLLYFQYKWQVFRKFITSLCILRN